MDEQTNLSENNNTTIPQKRVSEVLDWERDIEPYRLIEITAGMGSGKNYWVENDLMMKPQGKEQEYKRVLLITSRKSKVKETVNRTGLVKAINLSQLEPKKIDELWGDIKKRQGCCVCNNWHIEYYVKNIFRHEDESTHLWKYFDVIVVDEAHSLAADATFCDAPFHLLSFLTMVYRKSHDKIIFMTATPDPIDGLITLKHPELRNNLDLRTTCRNIRPQEVTYITQRRAIEEIICKYREAPDENWHIVYFATRTSTIGKKLIPALTEAGIPEDRIAVSFSRFDEDNVFSKTILANKERTEEYLAKNEDIPENIKIFISTSRNKEGINIDNPAYQWIVMIESQWADEIEQMYGRIRSVKDENLYYLIYDAPQHYSGDYEKSFEYILEKNCKSDIRTAFDVWCEVRKIKEQYRYNLDAVKKQVEELEKKKLTYLRYNIFSNQWDWYRGRVFGQRNYMIRREEYKMFIDAKTECTHYGSPIYPPLSIPYKFPEEQDSQKYVDDYIKGKDYLKENVYLSRDDVSAFLDYLSTKGIKNQSGKKYKNLGNILSKFGYALIDKIHNTTHPLYGYRQIVISEKPQYSNPEGGDSDSAI